MTALKHAELPRPAGLPRLPAPRAAVLAAVLDPSRLPTPPVIALQVAQTASRPDCRPAEIVALLGRDPALCGKLLQAVNSCLYALPRPVTSLDRAVVVLGLNTVRSLALGLSLPAARNTGPADPGVQEYWVASVGGAIIARELAARLRFSAPENELVAGLLRDLGSILLRETFPDDWRGMTTRWHPNALVLDPCAAEEATFGIAHPEVSAELLKSWNLPDEVVEPIRHHHHPDRLAAAAPVLRDRVGLLHFADLLAHLDAVVEQPDLLEYVLALAREQYGLPRPELLAFLNGVVPKIVAFGNLLNQDLSDCPDFGAVLGDGSREAVRPSVVLTRSRAEREGGLVPATKAAHRPCPIQPSAVRPAPLPPPVTPAPAATLRGFAPAGLPEFRPSFVDEFPKGGCRLGEYELRGVIGRGTVGIVYRAHEPACGRDVAVKVLARELAAWPVTRQRFAREGRAASAVRHENVVRTLAVREAVGMSYHVTELVDGESLQTRLKGGNPLPIDTVVRYGADVAAGLAAAHAAGVVHRDLKPANILVDAKTDRARVTDFGLARGVAEGKPIKDGTPAGSPHFTAPELAQGQPGGPPADLFSLGAVLYALLTGTLPFPGKDPAAVSRAVCTQYPATPWQLRKEIPAWLDAAVLRLLSKSPADRHASAAEVARLLAGRAAL